MKKYEELMLHVKNIFPNSRSIKITVDSTQQEIDGFSNQIKAATLSSIQLVDEAGKLIDFTDSRFTTIKSPIGVSIELEDSEWKAEQFTEIGSTHYSDIGFTEEIYKATNKKIGEDYGFILGTSQPFAKCKTAASYNRYQGYIMWKRDKDETVQVTVDKPVKDNYVLQVVIDFLKDHVGFNKKYASGYYNA